MSSVLVASSGAAVLHEVSDTGTLRGLAQLTQLSLEDNYIDAFDGFADCPELLELYLSNNLVEELRATSAFRTSFFSLLWNGFRLVFSVVLKIRSFCSQEF